MTAFLYAYPWVPMVAIVAAVLGGGWLAIRAQVGLDAKRRDVTSEELDDEGRPADRAHTRVSGRKVLGLSDDDWIE